MHSPLARDFDQRLVLQIGEDDDDSSTAVLYLSCQRPKGPGRKPTVAELERLDALRPAIDAALAAQRENLDIEGLRAAFACMLQAVGDLQGVCIAQDTIDLSPDVMDELSEQSLVAVPRELKLECIAASLLRLKLDCRELQTLPGWMEELTELQDLQLFGCDMSTMAFLPDELRDLPELREITLDGFPETHWLVESAGTLSVLQSLRVVNAPTLVDLPNMRGSGAVRLALSDCAQLVDLHALADMRRLVELSLSLCRSLVRIPSFQGLVSLRELRVENCVALRWLPEHIHAARLHVLDLVRTPSLNNLASVLGTLTALEELVLRDSGLSETPACLHACTRLQHLEIVVFKGDALPSFGAMVDVLPALQKLSGLVLSESLRQPGHAHQYGRRLRKEDVWSIAGALESYPPPHLSPSIGLAMFLVDSERTPYPPAHTDDASLMEFWRVQQCKVMWFVFGSLDANRTESHISGIASVLVRIIGDRVMSRVSVF